MVMPVGAPSRLAALEGRYCWPVAEAYPFFITISTPSPLLKRFEATPVTRPLCQKPPSPITAIGRRSMLGVTAAALASDMPEPRMEFARLNGAQARREVP